MTHTPEALRYTLTRQRPSGTTTTHHVTRYRAMIYAYCVYGLPLSAWMPGKLFVPECRVGDTVYRITNPDGVIPLDPSGQAA